MGSVYKILQKKKQTNFKRKETNYIETRREGKEYEEKITGTNVNNSNITEIHLSNKRTLKEVINDRICIEPSKAILKPFHQIR